MATEVLGLQAIGALMRSIARASGPVAIYDAALDALADGLGVHRASVLLFDPDGVMRFKAWRGLSADYRRAVEGHTPWPAGIRDAAIIVLADVRTDPALTHMLPAILDEGIGAMAFVPLTAADGVIGKFMLYFDTPRALTNEERTLAEVIAAQVAFALQRQAAEDAVSRRERELRLVTDVAPVYIAHCDRESRYRFVNRPFAERFGLAADDVVGRTVTDFLGAAGASQLQPHIEVVLAGRPVQFEVSIPYAMLGERAMAAHLAPEFDEEGTVTGFVAVISDVTERRLAEEARHNAEEALRESEALFRQLADSLPQMVWMARADGHTDYYNERWYEFTGFDRSLTGDESWIGIVHPDDVDRALATWGAAVATGQPYDIEYRFFDRHSGAYRWQLGRALPLCDAQGRVTRWFGTCTDIDDSKRAEQASRFLAEAGRSLASLRDAASALETIAGLAVPNFADWCAVDVVEPDGSLRRLTLVHWDTTRRAAVHALGLQYPARREDPHGPYAVLESGRSELVADVTDGIIAACAHDDEHLQAMRAVGVRSTLSVPVRVGGAIVGVLTFLTADSGRRYRAVDASVAEELAYRLGIAVENTRLYDEAREADRQKDEFLAVLAHELRNPLAPIQTALRLIHLAPEDRARRDRACEIMDRQVQQMVRLVDDLLDISRITQGRIELRRERQELSAIVQRAVETSRPMIENGGHELTVTFPRHPIHLDADTTRLAQVFANLLNNAAKYTPRGGRITVTATRDGDQAVVRVRDTGEGIPSEMLTRIFDMFAQVDRSVEKAHGGLGIGLTLARRLVELHGGTIHADSTGAGAGSEFVVRLPALSEEPDADLVDGGQVAHGSAPAGARRRVLVVDDNHDAAECLGEVMRLTGHDVRTVHDGITAIAVAESFRPDAVLLDLGMPSLSGYDTARELRRRVGGEVLLIATTGWGQEEHRRRSEAAGFDHHLVKPIDPAVVARLLDRLAHPSSPGAPRLLDAAASRASVTDRSTV